MSATVFCPPEALIEDYPKLVKQTSRGYSLQNTSQQQSIFSHSLPSICSVMPANSSPQVKEENSHAVNFFNNPLPYYYQSQNRRENEVSGIYHGVGTNSSGVPAQASASFLPSAMSPQNSLSGGHNLFGPVPPKAVIKKPSKVVKSDKCTCKRVENHIPRPRNAFILFRQKHHQSVLKESTDLKTNPEVSRELARRWRALTLEEREHWNSLADEEKKNHAKKYPNYRYKPRRHKKSSQCATCQVNQVERQPTPPHNFSLMQEYSQIVMAPDQKSLKSPVISVHQNHLQLQQQQQSQQQQQLQQVQPAEQYSAHRYMHYANYHSQNQFLFNDGHLGLNHGVQPQAQQQSQQQNQQQSQQQYSASLQQRTASQHRQSPHQHHQHQNQTQNQHQQLQQHQLQHQHQQLQLQQQQLQHHHQQHQHQHQHQQLQQLQHEQLHNQQQEHQQQPQPQAQQAQQQSSPQSYSSAQSSQLQAQTQNPGNQASQGLVTSQFHSYADKYHETAVSYQYQDQAAPSQKYNGLPTPLANNMYNGPDAFTVPASLQSY